MAELPVSNLKPTIPITIYNPILSKGGCSLVIGIDFAKAVEIGIANLPPIVEINKRLG
jgi:hypothetical protein